MQVLMQSSELIKSKPNTMLSGLVFDVAQMADPYSEGFILLPVGGFLICIINEEHISGRVNGNPMVFKFFLE